MILKFVQKLFITNRIYYFPCEPISTEPVTAYQMADYLSLKPTRMITLIVMHSKLSTINIPKRLMHTMCKEGLADALSLLTVFLHYVCL